MIKWTLEARNDYLYWQSQDKKTIKRINLLINDIIRNGNMDGIGKPEPLQYEYQGIFSRRIDEKNRLVYINERDGLVIISCRFHY